MRQFRIIASVKSYSVLPEESMEIKISAEGISHHVIFKNKHSLDLIGQSYCNELSILYELPAESILLAIQYTRNYLNQLLDQMALSIGMPIYELQIEKAYEITINTNTYEYIQFFYNVLDKVGSRSTNTKLMSNVIYNLMRQDNERIGRALHWYRKSLKEEDSLDRFSYIWTGLETLNPIFQTLYPDQYEITRCENCEYERKNKSTAPLKNFFGTILNNEALYSKARRIRTGYVHGFEELIILIKQAVDIIPDLTKALRSAICYVSDIEITSIDYNVDLWDASPISCIFKAQLTKLNTNITSPKFIDPEFDLEINIVENDGSLVLQPIVSTELLNHGVGFRSIDFSLNGRPGYPLKYLQIQLKG